MDVTRRKFSKLTNVGKSGDVLEFPERPVLNLQATEMPSPRFDPIRVLFPASLSLPRRAVAPLALLMVFFIGALDYASDEFTLSAFYLVPICWACWAAGRTMGLFTALASALVWLVSELMTGHIHKYATHPQWNALTLLLLFCALAHLLSDIRWLNRTLEEKVQQRTAALGAEISQREHAEQARLQAERLAVAGTMAAQVAHEVRNPLGSIKLNLDLVLREIRKLGGPGKHSTDEGETLVHEMREEVGRIQRVIESYLSLARLPKPQRRPIDANVLLEQKLVFMQSAFEKARIELRTDLDPALEPLNADAAQLWQALLNLIRNSLEAMPQGGKLAITTRSEDSRAVITIEDTGHGIPETDRGHLFVPFFSTKQGGTGLGLALTQQILHEHGAEIECASRSGQGTTFTIQFPLTAT